MTTITGTPDTRTEHSPIAAMLGIVVAVGIPAFLAILGLGITGAGAISWASAILWGAVAALAMSIVVTLGRAMGITEMNIAELLGSMIAEPKSSGARILGMGFHLVNGALLAIGWAFTMALFGWPATWLSGLLWGAFIAVLAMVMFSSIGAAHPRIREGNEEDPGFLGTNLGKMTPMGIIMAHLVYGFTIGALYQWVPLT